MLYCETVGASWVVFGAVIVAVVFAAVCDEAGVVPPIELEVRPAAAATARRAA